MEYNVLNESELLTSHTQSIVWEVFPETVWMQGAVFAWDRRDYDTTFPSTGMES